MPQLGKQYLTRVSTVKEARQLVHLLVNDLGFQPKDVYYKKLNNGHMLRQLVTSSMTVSGQQSECEYGVFYPSDHDVFHVLQRLIFKSEKIFGPLTIHSLFTHSVEDCVESIFNRHPLADRSKIRTGVNALRRSISAGRELKNGSRTAKRRRS